jgi:RNA polymerase sigma factor (sigma-70 family)
MLSSDQVFVQLKADPRNSELWDKLYDLLEPKLHRYSSGLLGRMRVDSSYADDVVQDVLMRLVKDFPKIVGSISDFSHLENYLMRSCRNRILDHHRMIQVRASKEEVLRLKFEDLISEGFARQFRQIENRQFVEELLKQLNPRCEHLVRSFLLSAQTLTEYAAQNEIKIGTIYTQWQRCLAELKKIAGM